MKPTHLWTNFGASFPKVPCSRAPNRGVSGGCPAGCVFEKRFISLNKCVDVVFSLLVFVRYMVRRMIEVLAFFTGAEHKPRTNALAS